MRDPVDLGFAFGLPPERAVEYFRSKGYQITAGWRDMWQEAHAKRFTVAHAARLEILHDIRQGLDRGLNGEITERDFIRELEPRLKARGWWGKQIIVDSEGRAEQVQLGSPHRLKTIYRTNLQTAYMAARYRGFKENTAARPWWQYVAVLDARTRPAHAALNGRVFRHDDPIWQKIWPPNGFNCRCRVRALSDKNLADRGITPSESEGYVTERPTDDRVDRDTGELSTVASVKLPGMRRAFTTDPGWNYNPGEAWALWDKAGRIPDDVSGASAPAGGIVGAAIQAATGQYTWRSYARPDLRDVPAALRLDAPELLARASTRTEAADELAGELGVSAAAPLRVVNTPVEQVALRYEWLPHLVENELDARERYAAYLIPTLTEPLEVWLTRYRDGGYRKRYIGLFTGRNDMMVVVRENIDGSLMWNFMHARDQEMNAHRAGALLYMRKIGGGP